jgi:hypothetical protein
MQLRCDAATVRCSYGAMQLRCDAATVRCSDWNVYPN